MAVEPADSQSDKYSVRISGDSGFLYGFYIQKVFPFCPSSLSHSCFHIIIYMDETKKPQPGKDAAFLWTAREERLELPTLGFGDRCSTN